MAVDLGDRIEVRSKTGAKRILCIAVAAVLAVAGVALAVLGPGGLADSLLARVGFSAVLVAAGVVSLATAMRWLEIDPSGITQHGLLGSRSIPSPQVDEIALDEHSDRPSSTFSRRVGGMRVGLGGGRRRTRVLGMRRQRWSVALHVRSRDDDRELVIGLNGTSLEEAKTLVEALRRRAALPEDVTVHVRSDRSGAPS